MLNKNIYWRIFRHKSYCGFDITYKNLSTIEIKKVQEHRGTYQFLDSKELDIKIDEYLIDFHIRFKNDAEYISQVGFTTNKKQSILEDSEEGEGKIIESNVENNIILGIF